MNIYDSAEAWGAGRPLFNRLPEKGYKDSQPTDAVTVWVDEYLVKTKQLLETFYLSLDPATCPDDQLDYLAYLVGLSGTFWDTRWSPEVKRAFINQSHVYLWRNRGTLACLKKVLDIHNLSYDIWQDGNLTLPFAMSSAFGTAKMRLYIRLPLIYLRGQQEWLEANRTARNFVPAVVKHQVCYEYFALGISRLGEPMFNA